jgi:hypothetical protein
MVFVIVRVLEQIIACLLVCELLILAGEMHHRVHSCQVCLAICATGRIYWLTFSASLLLWPHITSLSPYCISGGLSLQTPW